MTEPRLIDRQNQILQDLLQLVRRRKAAGAEAEARYQKRLSEDRVAHQEERERAQTRFGESRAELDREIDELHANGVRLRIIGDLSRFEKGLRELIVAAEARTASNTRLQLTIAANYGGRWDIMQAVNAMLCAQPGKQSGWTEADLESFLSMSFAPEPDLFIRTGGEERISNSSGRISRSACTSCSRAGENGVVRLTSWRAVRNWYCVSGRSVRFVMLPRRSKCPDGASCW